MYSTPDAFQVLTLISSTLEVVSTHSELPDSLLTLQVNEQVPDTVIGDGERICRALIIILERALIQRPGVPIRLTCEIAEQPRDRASICFSLKQDPSLAATPCSVSPGGANDETNTSTAADEMSIRIVDRIIRECGGNLFLRARDHSDGEISIRVPVSLTSVH